jgi:uncharacterized membrane protein HdeD (DUF308 family)
MDMMEEMLLKNDSARKYIMSQPWWAFALRGVCALIFGAIAFAWPGSALRALAIIFGFYAFFNGIVCLAASVSGGKDIANRGLLFIQGGLGIVSGIIMFFCPLIADIVILALIIGWAVVSGILELSAASRLPSGSPGKWMLFLSGALSLIFGVFLLFHPAAGMVAVVYIVGIYAIFFGIMMLFLSGTLKNLQGRIKNTNKPEDKPEETETERTE